MRYSKKIVMSMDTIKSLKRNIIKSILRLKIKCKLSMYIKGALTKLLPAKDLL